MYCIYNVCTLRAIMWHCHHHHHHQQHHYKIIHTCINCVRTAVHVQVNTCYYVASPGHWTSSFASSLWPIFYNVKCGTLGDSWLLHADMLSVDEGIVSVKRSSDCRCKSIRKEVDRCCLRRYINDVQNVGMIWNDGICQWFLLSMMRSQKERLAFPWVTNLKR